MIRFLIFGSVFMAIWLLGCAFVDLVVPDIANAYQMAVGFATGYIGLEVAKLASNLWPTGTTE